MSTVDLKNLPVQNKLPGKQLHCNNVVKLIAN